jgi:hypothetical protein
MKFNNLFFLFFCLLVVAACTKETDTFEEEKPIITEKKISDYRLKLKQNGTYQTIPGTINENTSTIVLKPTYNDWIENIDAATATFISSNRVLVGNVEQTSGKTPNDFRQTIIYTVVGGDGKTTRNYTVTLVSPQSSGLPVVMVDTKGGAGIYDKVNYVESTFKLVDAANPGNNVESLEKTGIRGRGNASWNHPKKPYRIKFDKKTSLFDLGAAKSWVLLSNYQDPTFITNTVALELGRRLGLASTNHTNHVELFLNKRYQGNYILTEQVQVNEHRVNISEKEGFLVEFDDYYDEQLRFRSSYINLPVNVKSPEDVGEQGIEFVKKSVNGLLDAMFKKNIFPDPDNDYKNLINIESVIKYLIVNEVVANHEPGNPKSTFMYKDKGNAKIYMGPLWDFDWAFGYDFSGDTYFVRNYRRMIYYQKAPSITGGEGEGFFFRFFDDPIFRTEYKRIWNEIKPSISNIDEFVNKTGAILANSATEDNERWSNHKAGYTGQITAMSKWIKERIAFLDTQINSKF